MGNTEETKLISYTATSIILLVIYSATLYRVLTGSKFQLVIRLIVLLMLYNIGSPAHQWLVYYYLKFLNKRTSADPNNQDYDHAKLNALLSAEFIAIIIEYGCYGVSHWMFAFQYYQIAR